MCFVIFYLFYFKNLIKLLHEVTHMDGFKKRTEQKKKDILDAALKLVIKYGIKKVSINEIAKDADVSQVTIYNYFGSKDQLIDEVIAYYINNLWIEYEEIIYSD